MRYGGMASSPAGRVHILSSDTWEPVRSRQVHEASACCLDDVIAHGAGIYGLALDSTQTLLATGSYDGTAVVQRLDFGSIIPTLQFTRLTCMQTTVRTRRC